MEASISQYLKTRVRWGSRLLDLLNRREVAVEGATAAEGHVAFDEGGLDGLTLLEG